MEPFLGEILLFAGTYAPVGWALCNGQLLSISDYPALYQLIGTTYGGDGVTNFALPDLRGRLAVHQGTLGSDTYTLGQTFGQQTVTLTPGNLPPHTHALTASSATGVQTSPQGGVPAQGQSYSSTSAASTMSDQTVSSAGGNLPVAVEQPTLTLNYLIAVQGVYPVF